MLSTGVKIFRPGGDADAFALDPNFRYIRTTHEGNVGFAWLGHTEKTAEGPVQVYYSASGEVLRIRAGRLVGAAGFPVEWRRAETSGPSWRALAAADAPSTLTRVRDVMPGYRFGLTDALSIRRIPPPSGTALRGVDPGSLTWFEERFDSSAWATAKRALTGADANDGWLPPARYAVRLDGTEPEVVYSEICLAREFCLTWQRWSAAQQQSTKSPR